MARLPIPGSDSGQWGAILNDFLLTSLADDGTLNTDIVGTSQIKDGSITTSKIGGTLAQAAITGLVSDLAAKLDASQKGANNGIASLDTSGKIPFSQLPDYSAQYVPISRTVNGKSLSADIAISASDVGLANVDNTSDVNKPISTATQTALNAKADIASLSIVATSGSYADLSNTPSIPADSTLVHLTGAETISGNKDFTGALTQNGNAIVTTVDGRLSNQRTPLDGSVTTAKVADGAITPVKMSGLASVATSGSYTDLTNKPSIPTVNDASTTSKGVIQLAGDLGGTAVAPTVPGLANKVNTLSLGAANGVATLDTNGKVTSAQLPDYTTQFVPLTRTVNGKALSSNISLSASDVGLGNVDNTSDTNKPVSTATQAALNAKVSGPGSSTATALARWSDTSGTQLQDSSVTVDSSGTLQATNIAATKIGNVLPSQFIAANQASTTAVTVNTQILGTGPADSSLMNARFGANTAGVSNMFLKSRGATIGSNVILASGDTIGNIGFDGADGVNYIEAARIRARVDGNPAAGSMPGRLEFMTTPSGSNISSIAMTIDSSSNVGLVTNAPTHTLTLASTATGITYYNSTDQTTNYERLRTYWSSNTAVIATEAGGTGTVRDLSIGTTARRIVFTDSGTTGNTGGFVKIDVATSGANAVGFSIGGAGNWTAASGTNRVVQVTPRFLQTGTAGYTALLVNPTETSVGSGPRLLLDLQANDVSKLSVASTGNITLAEGVNIATGTTTGTQIGTSTTQKVGFLGVNPVAIQGSTTDLGTVLSNFGFRNSGSAYTITTSGTVQLTGGVRLGGSADTAATISLLTSSSPNRFADATANAITYTLPSTSSIGYTFTIKKIDSSANVVTINGTIDGATNYTLTARYKYVTVVSTSTSGVWYITGNN